jgi:hypothetical protein
MKIGKDEVEKRESPVCVMGMDEPLPTITREELWKGARLNTIPGLLAMCDVAPVSKYQSLVGM